MMISLSTHQFPMYTQVIPILSLPCSRDRNLISSMEQMLITPSISLRFTANLVHESTIACSSFVPKIDAIKLHVGIL